MWVVHIKHIFAYLPYATSPFVVIGTVRILCAHVSVNQPGPNTNRLLYTLFIVRKGGGVRLAKELYIL